MTYHMMPRLMIILVLLSATIQVFNICVAEITTVPDVVSVDQSGTYRTNNDSTIVPIDSEPFLSEYRIPDEQRLLRKLMANYDHSVRPVFNISQSVVVNFSLTLVQIMDMDEKNQILVTKVWLEHSWIDERIRWEPSDYNQLRIFRMPASKLWLPDIVLYNSADDFTVGYMPTNAMVHSNGLVFWAPPARLRSSCKVDITYFPFDQQSCLMKFGSWTYDQAQVDVVKSRDLVDMSNYITNGEWSFVGTRIVRNEVRYPIGPAVYPDVTVYVVMRRRILYYVLNIILPCLSLNLLSLLAFCLPPDAGEKVTLGITVLLSYSVFMLLVAENMPPTSEFVPLIGIYLTISMAVTSVSVVFTVWVLKLHHCGPHQAPMPQWLRRFVRRFGAKTFRKPADRSHGNTLRWGHNTMNALATNTHGSRKTGKLTSAADGRTKYRKRGNNSDETGSSRTRQPLNYDFDDYDEKSMTLKSKWRNGRQRQTTKSSSCCHVEADIGNSSRLSSDKLDAFLSLVRQMSKVATVQTTVESEGVVGDQRRTNTTGSAIISHDSYRPSSLAGESTIRVDEKKSPSQHHQPASINTVTDEDNSTRPRCPNKLDAARTVVTSAIGAKQQAQSSMTCAGQVRPQAVGGVMTAAASVAIYRRLALLEETLRHLANIMSRVEKENTDNEVTAEWRNLAAIADRWLFWAFMTVTIVYTGVTMVLIPFYLQ